MRGTGRVVDAHAYADAALGPLDSRGAARFLGLSYEAFRKVAPSLPRHEVEGVGYRYLRSELLAWVAAGGRQVTADLTATQALETAQIRTSRRQGGPKTRVKRLI